MLSRRTMRGSSTGAFQMAVWTVLPCHVMSRGRPTLTESKRAIIYFRFDDHHNLQANGEGSSSHTDHDRSDAGATGLSRMPRPDVSVADLCLCRVAILIDAALPSRQSNVAEAIADL